MNDKSFPHLIKPNNFLSTVIQYTENTIPLLLNHPLAQNITCDIRCINNNSNELKYLLINCDMEGALVQIAFPMNWRKCLIIHCHGHRPHGIGLQADLNVENTTVYQTFLKEGFCVAMTSYRRQGIIVKDALLDVNNVRDFVVYNFGEPDVVVLEGRSMGGAIVTYLSELFPELYNGAVAIGAALYVDQREEEQVLSFEYTPRFPILYLTNVSELSGPENYRNLSKLNADKYNQSTDSTSGEIYVPAIWEVSREGHNSVNTKERESAMFSLLNWIQYQTFITVRHIDNTQFVTPIPSQVTFTDDNSGAWGKVVSIDGVFGSIIINFQEQDFSKLFIYQGKSYSLKLYKGDNQAHEITVHLGTYPFIGVPSDSYICYYEPDTGFSKITIKTYKYSSVAKRLNVTVNGLILIRFNYLHY
jgi:hypothetical protein